MPELPEIEIVKHDLERELIGKKFKAVELSSMAYVDGARTHKQLDQKVVGHKVLAVRRLAATIIFDFGSEASIAIQLGPGGYILKAKSARGKDPEGTQIAFKFPSGGPLRIIDVQKGSKLVLFETEELEEALPDLAGLGLDPLAGPVSWQDFGRALVAREGKLKNLLLDKTLVAGLGPMYVDEILFEAGLKHSRTTESLTAQEVRRLFRALVGILGEAVKHGGTSTEEEPFFDLYGKEGGYAEMIQIYDRAGEPCPRCRKPIKKTRIGGVPTFYSESQV